MYTKICSECKNKFSSKNKYIEGDSELHSDCIPRKISRHINKKKRRLARTSTPIKELENSARSNCSDSVSDFFYQTWKNGLHANDTINNQEQQEQEQQQQQQQQQLHQQLHQQQQQQQIIQSAQPNIDQQPMFNAAQVVYVNTVIFQPLVPQYFQQVGFIPNGTFGVYTTYWPMQDVQFNYMTS